MNFMKKLLATLAFTAVTIAAPIAYAATPTTPATPPAVETAVCFTALEGLIALRGANNLPITMLSMTAAEFFANIEGELRPDIYTVVIYLYGEDVLLAAFDDSGCYIEDVPLIKTTVDAIIADFGITIAAN